MNISLNSKETMKYCLVLIVLLARQFDCQQLAKTLPRFSTATINAAANLVLDENARLGTGLHDFATVVYCWI